MRTKNWPETASLLVIISLILTVPLGAESTGFCITNPVYLPDGRGQFEVMTPDAGPYALFYSMDLGAWEYWQMLTGMTQYVVQTPGPISDVGGRVFFRAVTGGAAVNRLSFLFQNAWNGPLVGGTPALSWPQQIQDWHARFDVVNSLVFPPVTSVLYSGPAGSGMVNQPAHYFGPDDAYSGSYYAYSPDPTLPPGGLWTVDFDATILNYNQPDPEVSSRFVMIVPNFVINGGVLESVSWTYRDPSTGAVLGGVPDYVTNLEFKIYGPDFALCAEQDNKIFDSDSLSLDTTNFVFSPPIAWNNALVQFRYEDTLDNEYVINYSFGNLYEVWGTNNFFGYDGCDPAAGGFTLLGSDTGTATFLGQYKFYMIRVPKHNLIKVDTYEGSTGNNTYPPFFTGRVDDFPNLGGAPDGMCATVGRAPFGFHSGSVIVIDATIDNPLPIWLKVYICP